MSYFYLIIAVILIAVCSGYQEFLRWKEQYVESDPLEDRKLNTLWHYWRDITFVFLLMTGFILGKLWLDLLTFIHQAILLAVIQWIVADGTQNLLKKRNFFKQNLGLNGSTAMMEVFNWKVKLALLLFAIFFKYVYEGYSIIMKWCGE